MLLPLGSTPRLHSMSRRPKTSLIDVGVIERSDKFGQLLFGDPAQLADLEAAQLAGPEQVIDLVPADVQHLRYLLDGVCLQRLFTSSRGAAGLSFSAAARARLGAFFLLS